MSQPSRKTQLRDLIIEAATISAEKRYKGDPTRKYFYAVGLLSELLSYSALNQVEIYERLEKIVEKNKNAK